MKLIRYVTLVLSFFAAPAGAEMVRVTAIHDGRTLIVERGGKSERIVLAGVGVDHEAGARELLRWTVGGAWVLIEPAAGGWHVWRSPDALFINRELVRRGYAVATMPGIEDRGRTMATYLGEINPPGPQATGPKKTAAKKPAALKPPKAPRAKSVKSAAAKKTGSGTSRRSTGSPSPRQPGGRRSAAPD